MNKVLKINCKGCMSRYDVSDLDAFSVFHCPRCGRPLRVPEKFGCFLLEKLCGKGGMSRIYRALDTRNNQGVAVQIFDPDCDDVDLKSGYGKEADLPKKLYGKIGIKNKVWSS